ncbi:hypothetical protein EMIHUDRAFT_217646 [Emiliania huxleyi CCMP1516]|uniref:L-ornithine N(5)-monooxygenase [NAD(P)H] n=3 Tax=Emiliania huxleyi TaxID=2903 RepID=A0A0D3IA19_EMIH1|nr:hypothetical protein EMIHUDRAFT_217646 [Emiliania huxleyi CCMP1516]EOD08104.1 hypothetical protein EMIHUDRAFT_217646 [Emiliania huxleyi CCMP1516]|eukprot:XP_005760533.1 hypothetical protein EMIHUDRAFT_217646 [Emiliania huxleyi CCMP1516]
MGAPDVLMLVLPFLVLCGGVCGVGWCFLARTLLRARVEGYRKLVRRGEELQRAPDVEAARRPSRRPEGLRVAVVGGGWTGVRVVGALRRRGVQQITAFEQAASLGGSACGASLHHLGTGELRPPELLASLESLARRSAAWGHFRFRSAVRALNYDPTRREATLRVQRTDGGRFGAEVEYGPFDCVVWASLDGRPSPPHEQTVRYQEAFQGRITHASALLPEELEEAAARLERVVVVGASKAACDLVLALRRNGHASSLTWAVRRPYTFLRLEALADASASGAALHLANGVAAAAAPFAPRLSGLVWARWADDWGAFRVGVLSEAELSLLRSTRLVVGEPLSFSEGGIHFSGGRWYRHLIAPRCPVLASAAECFTGFGPAHGETVARLLVDHLCDADSYSLGEEELEAETRSHCSRGQQLFGAPRGRLNPAPQWLLLLLDLTSQGLLEFTDLRDIFRGALRTVRLPRGAPHSDE